MLLTTDSKQRGCFERKLSFYFDNFSFEFLFAFFQSVTARCPRGGYEYLFYHVLYKMADAMLRSRKNADKEMENTKTMKITGEGSAADLPKKDSPKKSIPVKKVSAKTTPSTNSTTSSSNSVSNSKPKDVNVEVLKILQELNNTVNKQHSDIQVLSNRVDQLYDYDYEQETCEYDDEYENIDPACSVLSNQSDVVDIDSDEPPYKKQKTALFKGLSDKFLLAEKVDQEVNEDLALFVNSSFRNGVSDERITEIMRDIHRPQNCESLTKTRVNVGMWRLLKPQTQTDDARMQAIQNCIIKASINVTKLLDKEGEGLDGQSIEWGTNALALLGQSNRLINNKRKDAHKNDLDPKFFPLTSSSLPYTEYLYGDESDINRNVKDIQDMSRIGKIGRVQRGRGFRGGHYRRGRGPRRGFRGRGYRPDSSTVSSYGSKNSKEGQKK